MDPSPTPSPSIGPPAVNVISPKKSGPPRKVLVLGTLAILILGIVVAIYLVQSRQLISTGACDCSLYNFYIDSQGNVSVTNGQATLAEPAQRATVSIDGSPITVLDVPALAPGASANLGSVTVPESGEFTWSVTGSAFCSDSGSHVLPTPSPTEEITPTVTITITPTEEITPTVTATPVPTETQQPTVTPSATPVPTETVAPTTTPVATATPSVASSPTPTSAPPPAPPNRCNGACNSDANCTYGEDGVKLICVKNLCRHPSCSDQISCHCPSTPPAVSASPTPTQNLAQTGDISPTLTISLAGFLLIGLGILLAL